MPDLTVGQIKSKRMLYLALSTLTLLFLGLIYAFSMFAGPICTTFGLEKAAVGLTFNIMMITFCVGAVIGSQIEAKIGVRNTLFVAAALFFCGFAGTGLFGNGSITVVYLCYGVLGGLGVGVGYNSVIATTNVWFPDKVGFSSGVLMMGFGLGSLILGTLSVNLAPTLGLGTVFAAIGVITALVVVGDGNGRVGVGMGKSQEVPIAIKKGVEDAKKNMFSVPLTAEKTLPHEIIGEYGAGRVLIKPATPGTGVIAGGAARAVMELAGVTDCFAKSLGTDNVMNVVKATAEGLKNMESPEQVAARRDTSVAKIYGWKEKE